MKTGLIGEVLESGMSEIGGFKRVIAKLEQLTGPLGITGRYLAAHEQQWLETVVNGYGELLEREDEESTSGEFDDSNVSSATWVQIEREAGPLANDLFSVIERLKSLGQASRLMLSKIEDIDLSALDIDINMSNKEIRCIQLAKRAMNSLALHLWLTDQTDLDDQSDIDAIDVAGDCSTTESCEKIAELKCLAILFKKLTELADLRKGKPLLIESKKKITESMCIEWLIGELINFNTSQNTSSNGFPADHVVEIAQTIHDGLSNPKSIPVFDTGWGKIEFNRIKARVKRSRNGTGLKSGTSRFEINEDSSVSWIPESDRQKIKVGKEFIHRAPRANKRTK